MVERERMPNPLVPPLGDLNQLAQVIAGVTERAEDDVRRELEREAADLGVHVREEMVGRSIPFHVWSPALAEFYARTDAFLYELAIWNRHPSKLAMRSWIGNFFFSAHAGRPLRVLALGDGLGFDSAFLAQIGHFVTYVEVSEWSLRFAREVFRRNGLNVEIETDLAKVAMDSLDAVICLDVLEHVPDPPGLVAALAACLRPGGWLIVHAPFHLVGREWPTHLATNRRYCGSLGLYRRSGLHLYAGTPMWDPIVLAKGGPNPPSWKNWSYPWRLVFRGLVLRLGRFASWPFALQARWYRARSRSAARDVDAKC
jgi:2-polyprenyl-3-methyl-5-hydroxy-6-metoxy-1,4-benzoquinol methylase